MNLEINTLVLTQFGYGNITQIPPLIQPLNN